MGVEVVVACFMVHDCSGGTETEYVGWSGNTICVTKVADSYSRPGLSLEVFKPVRNPFVYMSM